MYDYRYNILEMAELYRRKKISEYWSWEEVRGLDK